MKVRRVSAGTTRRDLRGRREVVAVVLLEGLEGGAAAGGGGVDGEGGGEGGEGEGGDIVGACVRRELAWWTGEAVERRGWGGWGLGD